MSHIDSGTGVVTTTLGVAGSRSLPRAILSCRPEDPFLIWVDAQTPVGPAFWSLEYSFLQDGLKTIGVIRSSNGIEFEVLRLVEGERLLLRLPTGVRGEPLILEASRGNLELFLERCLTATSHTNLNWLASQ